MMRLSYRTPDGGEVDHVTVRTGDMVTSFAEAMSVLGRRDRFAPGDALFFEDDETRQPAGLPVILTANQVVALAGSLEHHARLIEGDQPESAADVQRAARFLRLAVQRQWVFTSVVLP